MSSDDSANVESAAQDRGAGEQTSGEQGGAAYRAWREELRRAWSDLRGGTLSPARLGASVAMGVFIGCLPLFGLHLPLVLLLSLRLRLDGAVAYLAANISNPLFAPFLFAGETQVGALLLDGAIPAIATLELSDAWTRFPRYLAVGAPVTGVSLGLILGLVTAGATQLKRRVFGVTQREPYRLPESAPEWVKAVERVAHRYAPDERQVSDKVQFNYVRIKLQSDPVAKMVADFEGQDPGALGKVFDLGTGRGQLPLLLTELGRATEAIGVDWDEKKIRDGSRAASLSPSCPVTLSQGDARSAPIEPADTVLLIDILHYFQIDEQKAMLERAARAVRPGGRILVREADTERGVRSFITLLEERIFTGLSFNRGERVKFRKASDLAAELEALGLSTEVRPAWGKTPFSNVLIVGRRPI